jgi:hypothetical protein
VFQGAAVEGVELLAASAFFLFDRLQQSSGHREGLGVVGGRLQPMSGRERVCRNPSRRPGAQCMGPVMLVAGACFAKQGCSS